MTDPRDVTVTGAELAREFVLNEKRHYLAEKIHNEIRHPGLSDSTKQYERELGKVIDELRALEKKNNPSHSYLYADRAHHLVNDLYKHDKE